MHKARISLTLCAGVFLLALTYYLGVRGAEGKTAPQVTAAAIIPSGSAVAFLAARDRMVHVAVSGSFTGYHAMTLPGPVPGQARIVALGTNGGSALDHLGVFAMLEDGDIYIADTARGVWMPVSRPASEEDFMRMLRERLGR